MISKLKEIQETYRDYIPATFFIGGFVFDTATIGRVDDYLNIVQLLFFLVLLYLFTFFEITNRAFLPNTNFLFNFINKEKNEIYHFVLGACLSMFTLLFFKSASLKTSLVFMLLMVAVLLANETKKFKGLGVPVKSFSFSLCLASFFIIFLPTVLGFSNQIVFVLSILISVLIIIGLYKLKSSKTEQNLKKQFLAPSILVCALLLVSYFTRVIPPVPLSLQHIGIYKTLEKVDGTYKLGYQAKWWKFWSRDNSTYHYQSGDKVYVFTQVFSPGGFAGEIFYRWQVFQRGKWRTSDLLPVQITGGRGEGFRGYAYKQNIMPGQWRILVENEVEQELGRTSFEIIPESLNSQIKYISK